MISREMLLPWVEKCVMEALEADHVHSDNEGDYPITLQNTVAYVRLDVDPARNPRVQIFAPILRDVKATPELFEKLNELNSELSYFRFRYIGGVVDALTEIAGESFRTEQLKVVLPALDAYAEQLAGLLGVPDALMWKIPVAEPDGSVSEQADPPALEAGEETEPAETGKPKKKSAPKKDDPDENPPPGYL